MAPIETAKKQRSNVSRGQVLAVIGSTIALSQLAIGPTALLLDRGLISRKTADTLESTVFVPVTYPASRSPTLWRALKSYISLWESPPPPTVNGAWTAPAPILVQPGETTPPPLPLNGQFGGLRSPSPPTGNGAWTGPAPLPMKPGQSTPPPIPDDGQVGGLPIPATYGRNSSPTQEPKLQ